MKKALKALLEYCEILGEDKVISEMNEAYSDGAQAEEIIFSTVNRLNDILRNKKRGKK